MINPQGLALKDWTDSLILTFGSTWSSERLDDEASWQDWATGFIRAPLFAQRDVPDPYQFDDWREWAMRVYPMLEGLNAV